MPCQHDSLDFCERCFKEGVCEECGQACKACGRIFCGTCLEAHDCRTRRRTLSIGEMEVELERASEAIVTVGTDIPYADTFPSGRPHIVLPNDETSISLEIRKPKTHPFRTLLWNIANLGGKFGYPMVRDESVIQAIAYIIHTANPHIVTILEVLERGAPERPPKEPLQLRQSRPRDQKNAMLAELHRKLGDAQNRMAQWFAAHARAAIWPGVGPETTSEVDTAAGTYLERFQTAWATVKEDIAQYKPGAELAEQFARGEISGQTILGQTTKQRDGTVSLQQQLTLLAAEGYTHFLDTYMANNADESSEALSPEEQDARNKVCKEALDRIRDTLQEKWVAFIAAFLGPDAKKKPDLQNPWNLMIRATEENRKTDYNRRLEIYNARKEKQKAGKNHHGIRELLRIRDALNALSGAAYACWPGDVPQEGTPSIYTEGETYGVLWKKAAFDVDETQIKYVRRSDDVRYDKRAPISVPFVMRGIANTPAIHVVAWHAPAPSPGNARARANDFRAFIDYSHGERAAKRLGIVLTDLNVNTATESELVEHCDNHLTIPALFDGICGKASDSAYDAQEHVTTTIVKTNIVRVLNASASPLRMEEESGLERVETKPRKPYDRRLSLLHDPQHRYGASAYDKILPICTSDGRWSVRQTETFVIPFPHSVALPAEAVLLRDETKLALPVQPFAFLLHKRNAEVLKMLRAYAEQNEPVRKLVELLATARYLSDHAPLVASFLLVDGDSAAMLEEIGEWSASPSGHPDLVLSPKGVMTDESNPSPSNPSKPALTDALCLWASDVYWAREDAQQNPHALFLFGENHQQRYTTFIQKDTQACIRGLRNAAAVRTCWLPDGSKVVDGAMTDAALKRNQRVIDKDLRRARNKLDSGRYTTLVVPWDIVRKATALGTGVANLPDGAPETYKHLSQAVAELAEWAKACLRSVLVIRRETDLTHFLCTRDPASLYIFECDFYARSMMNRFSNVVSPLNALNVRPVRTAPCVISASAELSDARAGSADDLRADFTKIEKAISSGKYRRIVLPAGSRELGSATKLAAKSPNLYAQLQQHLTRLEQLCAAIDVSSVDVRPQRALPKQTSNLRSPPSGVESETDEWDPQTVEQIKKLIKLESQFTGQ